MASHLYTLQGFHLALGEGERPHDDPRDHLVRGLPPLVPASLSPLTVFQPQWPLALPSTQQASFSASPLPEKLFPRCLLSSPPCCVQIPPCSSPLWKSPFPLRETQHLLSLRPPSGRSLRLCLWHHLAFDVDVCVTFSCLPSLKCKHRDHY